MGTPTPVRNFFMRNMPCVSRTPGSATPIIRSLPKEVYLHEWWLVRAGKNLHVSGFSSRGKQLKEIFHSAPISKRHGTVTVETVDGITISIFGFINKFRTLENGFSTEVCDKFLLGFPYNWEEFASASDVSPSEANPQLSKTQSSSNYNLPVAFQDLPAVAIQDLLMCIPEDSKSSMLNIVVENIRKSYAVSSSAVEKMTDCLKAPGNSCTGGKTTDCLKEDASQGMNDSFTRENQTWNTANTVELEHTDIDVVPDPTSSVPRRVEISQNPEDGITMAGAGVRGNMDTASEKCLEGSCVDSHAGITMAGAGVKENINTASEHCLEFSCVDSRPSQAKSKTISDEGHTGSLAFGFNARENEITESEGNNKFHFVDYVVPRSCSKSKDNDGKEEVRRCRPPKKQKGRPLQKKRGRNPEIDASNVRVTRSMKRQRKSSLENTSAMPEVVTSAVVLETPRKQSHVVNMQRESFLQNTLATTNEFTAAVVLETPKKKTVLWDTSATTNGVTAAVVSDTPKKKTFLQETSAMTNGVTAAVVLGTPKKQSRALPARCQSPSTSKLSKQQDKTKKVDKSQKMLSTLRRSIRIQNRKCYADLP